MLCNGVAKTAKINGGVHISGYRRFAAKRRSKFRLLHIPFILDIVQRRGKKQQKITAGTEIVPAVFSIILNPSEARIESLWKGVRGKPLYRKVSPVNTSVFFHSQSLNSDCLSSIKLVIIALLRHKLIMRACLGNTLIIDIHNLVTASDSGKSVSDNKGSSALEHCI